jgi:hypothetical protein
MIAFDAITEGDGGAVAALLVRNLGNIGPNDPANWRV